GITMSNAKSYKFHHNDFEDLERLILKFQSNKFQIPKISDVNQPTTLNSTQPATIYIVTETVFSMDGDTPNLEELVELSEKYNCYLIVDEAHTLGVFGEKGEGLIQYLNLHDRIFARI